MPLPLSGFAVFRLTPRRGGSQTRPPTADHDTRRARRPGAPPQRAKPSALHENSPKPGGRGLPLPLSGFAVFRLTSRRGGSQTRPSFSDHDTRRARRPGAPPQRVKPSALHENSPKPGGRGKPLPYGTTGKPSHNGERAATEGRPYGGFNSPFWSRRDRRGSMAAAAIASPRTEIAL